MLKRLMTLAVAVATLTVAGCCGGGSCGPKCYGKNYQRALRQEMDFVDVYFLNYDKHDPFRCDPCLGD
jgi:hypothetical protein